MARNQDDYNKKKSKDTEESGVERLQKGREQYRAKKKKIKIISHKSSKRKSKNIGNLKTVHDKPDFRGKCEQSIESEERPSKRQKLTKKN